MGYKKAQNFMLIPNSLKWAKKCSSKSYWQKTTENSAKSGKLKICIVFAYNFLSGHFLSPFQRMMNQHKILRFFIAHTNF